MIPLEEKLSKMEVAEASKYRDDLRRRYNDEEYADLVRLVFQDLEQSALARIKSGPQSTEQLWGLVGALQTIEQARALLFTEENFDAGPDCTAQ